jgi:hypothetical protein
MSAAARQRASAARDGCASPARDRERDTPLRVESDEE